MEGGMASDRTFAASRFLVKPLYLQGTRCAGRARRQRQVGARALAIPNEVDLARELGISSGTMRKALDQLEGERVLTRARGPSHVSLRQPRLGRPILRFWRISAADDTRTR